MYQEIEKFLLYGVSFYLLVQIALSLKNAAMFAAVYARQDFSTIFNGVGFGFIGLGIFPL